MKPQLDIIPHFKERIGAWGPSILGIPDEQAKRKVLSIFYYLGEYSYGGDNPWFVPERFLSGNISASLQNHLATADTFFSVSAKIINELYYYSTSGESRYLESINILTTQLLTHCNKPIVDDLESYV